MSPRMQLLIQIQKALKVIQSELNLVLVTLKDSTETLSSIANLGEQLHCCFRYDHTQSCLSHMEDFQSRLAYKINLALEQKVNHLHGTIKIIENASFKITSQHRNILETYDQLGEGVSVVNLCEGDPFYPSPAIMMEWVSDIERLLFYLLSEKRLLIETCDFTSEEYVSTLKHKWKNDHSLRTKYSEIEAYTSFFLEQKLT